MMTFPSSLVPSVDYRIKVDTSVVRTKMESGRNRQRQRFTRDFRTMNVSWKLSDVEFGYFQSIYHHLLNSGADWFSMSLPMGDDFQTYTVRFVADTYQAKYDNVMYWEISAQLETEDETSPYSAEDIDALVAVDLDLASFSSALDILEYYTHVIMPTLIPA